MIELFEAMRQDYKRIDQVKIIGDQEGLVKLVLDTHEFSLRTSYRASGLQIVSTLLIEQPVLLGPLPVHLLVVHLYSNKQLDLNYVWTIGSPKVITSRPTELKFLIQTRISHTVTLCQG